MRSRPSHWLASVLTGSVSQPDEPTRTVEAHCAHCGEGLFFVDGVIGPDRWRHVRTGEAKCDPRCTVCGQPAVARLGQTTVNGDGSLLFRTAKWVCATHNRGLHIDHL